MTDDQSRSDRAKPSDPEGVEDTEAILSRRRFLIASGLATAGAAAGGCGEKSAKRPPPCLSQFPTEKDAATARPCLEVARRPDAGAPRPCLKVRPQPCLSKPPAAHPCLQPPRPPKPKPQVCLSKPAPKKP